MAENDDAEQPTWATYTPPESTPPSEPPPSEPVPSEPVSTGSVPSNLYGPPQTSSPEVARLFGTKPTSKAGCVIIPFAVILLAAIGVIVGVINAATDDSGDSFIDFPGVEETEPPQLFTRQDFNAMLDALREETGSTEVFNAVIYPEYASLDVPAEATGKRAYSYFYNGELGDPTKSSSTYQRFDLAQIDPAVMIRLVNKAKNTLVEDPTSWYVIIQKPGPPFDTGGWFSAYASNDFRESGYLLADLDGKILRTYVSE